MTAGGGLRVDWYDAEPAALEREKRAMPLVAPEMQWIPDLPAGGWRGPVPLWPFERAAPADLEAFVGSGRLIVEVSYTQAYPMVPPRVRPLEPEPRCDTRTQQIWHVNGDGTLCLMQATDDWRPTDTAADLVVKAASWYLEFLLMERGLIGAMSVRGLASDNSLDRLLIPYIHCGE
jgi:hypothetical protein